MPISIQIKGLEEVQKNLNKLSSQAVQGVESAIKQSGFFIQSEVVASINGERAELESVDTGRFRGDVKATFPNRFESIIGTNLDYPVYLEYGTSRIEARPHFRNTKARNEGKVVKFIDDEIKKIMK